MVKIHSRGDKPFLKPYYYISRRSLNPKPIDIRYSNLIEPFTVVCWVSDGLPREDWETFCRKYGPGHYRVFQVPVKGGWRHIISFRIYPY